MRDTIGTPWRFKVQCSVSYKQNSITTLINLHNSKDNGGEAYKGYTIQLIASLFRYMLITNKVILRKIILLDK